MLRKQIVSITIALASILLFACNGSNKYAKKAYQFEENGFYKQAANYYLISLRKKNTNIDARIGLIKNGQKVMETHLQEFFLAHTNEDYKKAVYSYKEALDYQSEVQETGVELNIPEYYNDYYNEDLEHYLSNLYTEGTELLNIAKYEQSNTIFNEINKLNPNFRDAGNLAILSKAEPLYIKAETSFDQEHYREAYNHYDAVVKLDKSYKDALEKREYAKKQAMLTIAILNEDKLHTKETDQLNAYILNKLVESNNPFITIVDRTNVTKILDEQKIGMSGSIDQSSVVSAGNLIGVEAVLLGTIISMKKIDGSLQRRRVEAYEKKSYQAYDKVAKKTKTYVKYNKTYYTSHYQKNSVELSFQYKLISVETGQIIQTDVFSGTISDDLNYASYSGNAQNLFPKPNATSVEKNKLDRLINGKKTINSSDLLILNIFNSISNQVSNKVIDYEKNRL